MSDIGVPQGWLVSPNTDVEDMWLKVQIQEKKSRISRYKQDIEDLEQGKILDIRARIIMLEREIQFLEHKQNAQTVEPEGITREE